MFSRDQTSRSYTRRLSQVLASPEGTLALSFLQHLATPPAHSTAPQTNDNDGRTIGIWQRADNGAYCRNPDAKADWPLWADVECLPVRDGHRRIAILGESVARGYFFDPGTTYASMVDDCLRSVPGLAGVDILDLAQTNASEADLRRTLREAVKLGLDALVLFAGNNWYYPQLSPSDRQSLADAIRTGGYSISQQLFHGLMVDRARQFLDDLAATTSGIPVTLVIPEFNLADWYEEPFLGCPVLADSGNAQWQRLREQAEQALTASRNQEAARIAREMIRLDGGSSVTAHRLLATALRDQDPAAAEQSLVAAKDAAIGRFTPHSPRILTAVQDEMRRKATEHGFALVDVPALLRQVGDAEIPGRRFFLDYSHLTCEGLVVVASATAAVLAGQLMDPGPNTTAAQLCSRLVSPPAARQAAAYFLAGVHNAHSGQPDTLVRFLLERALTLDNSAAGYIADYLDYQTRAAPNWVCASFARSAAVPELARYLHITASPGAPRLADHSLRRTMLELLIERGLASPDAYLELLIAEQAGPVVDLLADSHRAPTWRESSGSPAQPQSFVIAPGLHSDSWLVLGRPEEVELGLTARLPTGEPGESIVRVCVNEAEVGSATLNSSWRTVRITVAADRWRTGVNTVRIHWPQRELPGDRLLEAGAQALERGASPRTHPLYGHLSDLTATLLTA